MAATGPLAGVRVIDLSIWVQGPIAATLLADLGADVIKVENANGGDFSRNIVGLCGVDLRREGLPNLLWATCNRNKRTVSLDLHKESALPVFSTLVQGADVFVTNLHPGSLVELHADEAAIRLMNPRIVYARAAGLGDTGPRANDPCQDTVGMAYGGFMMTCGNEQGTPYYPPGAMNDVLSGSMLGMGILAALRQRDQTGEGQYVCSSQLQSIMWMQSLNFGVAANLGESFGISDREQPGSPLVNTYCCGDGRWIALGLILSTHWPVFCEAVGLQHLASDERFESFGNMLRNAVPLRGLLDEHFATAPAAHWLDRMRARGLWVSPVNSIADLVDDDQVRANGYVATLDDGWRAAAMPFSLRGHQPDTRQSPEYGAHTEEILREAGLDDEAILALRLDGAVW
jgi:crotonobetainyl-CoA:carnitine CoA-transferase CaiB-like acyl-CoA transferase